MGKESDTALAGNEKLKFIQYHKPGLTSGDYTVIVDHNIVSENTSNVSDKPNNNFSDTFHSKKEFSVQGSRFNLSPADIHSKYPRSGSFGEYHTVLPHIVLNRSTLPWEREPYKDQDNDNGASWLALLLFDQSEMEDYKVTQLSLKDLRDKDTDKLSVLGDIQKEKGQSWDDKVNVIRVKKSLLEKTIPSLIDLEFLSHIRLNTDSDGKVIAGEKATILCNRLPKYNSESTMHLVSLENRFTNANPDFPYVNSEDPITLVSLHSWSFSCARERGNFKEILEDLNVGTLRLSLKDENGTVYENSEAEPFLYKGFVPLRHKTRMGQQTASWYHGPLAPTVINWPSPDLPSASADKLLHYNAQNGLFDVSYAAAWELGRKLALEDKRFSMALFHWKRHLIMKKITSAQLTSLKHISTPGSTEIFDDSLLGLAEDKLLHDQLSDRLDVEKPGETLDNYGIPPIIETFFYHLRRLEGLPFNYLVPHDDMLPRESIRFFRMDPIWIDCLLDGAYSLGEDAMNRITVGSGHKHKNEITGFLLRSNVVSGWPGLLINGYDEKLIADGKLLDEDKTRKKTALKVIRSSYLADDVLLVLFEGVVQTADFFLAPDTLHFGLDMDDDKEDGYGDDADLITGQFWQVLRDENGIERNSDDRMKIKTIPFKGRGKDLVINIEGLAKKIETALKNPGQPTLAKKETFCSAHFALQMMEGAEKVRILRSSVKV